MKEHSPYFLVFALRTHCAYRVPKVMGYQLGGNVLDVPCGMGWGTSLITGARSLTGVDLCADAIAEAKRRYGHRAHFTVGDIVHSTLETQSLTSFVVSKA